MSIPVSKKLHKSLQTHSVAALQQLQQLQSRMEQSKTLLLPRKVLDTIMSYFSSYTPPEETSQAGILKRDPEFLRRMHFVVFIVTHDLKISNNENISFYPSTADTLKDNWSVIWPWLRYLILFEFEKHSSPSQQTRYWEIPIYLLRFCITKRESISSVVANTPDFLAPLMAIWDSPDERCRLHTTEVVGQIVVYEHEKNLPFQSRTQTQMFIDASHWDRDSFLLKFLKRIRSLVPPPERRTPYPDLHIVAIDAARTIITAFIVLSEHIPHSAFPCIKEMGNVIRWISVIQVPPHSDSPNSKAQAIRSGLLYCMDLIYDEHIGVASARHFLHYQILDTVLAHSLPQISTSSSLADSSELVDTVVRFLALLAKLSTIYRILNCSEAFLLRISSNKEMHDYLKQAPTTIRSAWSGFEEQIQVLLRAKYYLIEVGWTVLYECGGPNVRSSYPTP